MKDRDDAKRLETRGEYNKANEFITTPASQWNHRYVFWARKSVWLAAPMYVFFYLIPNVYEFRAELPRIEQSQTTNGVFFYEHTGKGGSSVVIKNSANLREHFSCRSNALVTASCMRSDIGKALNGKMGSVTWFEQPIYPFVTQRRLLRLVVEEKEEISYKDVVARHTRNKDQAPYWAGGLFCLLILIIVITEFYFLRRIEQR
jgi:hypothetical protein